MYRPPDAAGATSAPRAAAPGDGRGGAGAELAVLVLLRHPLLPQQPAEKGGEAAAADDGDGGDALLEDADEADDEDDDGADVLQDDGRVGDEGPKVVGLEARVALEVFEKGGLVRVVVGACE